MRADTIPDENGFIYWKEYQTDLGLFDLYQQRSGGTQVLIEMHEIALASQENIPDSHHLLQELQEKFIAFGVLQDEMDYFTFYHAFLITYISCYQCTKFDAIMQVIDIDSSGTISWDEISFNAKWEFRRKAAA